MASDESNSSVTVSPISCSSLNQLSDPENPPQFANRLSPKVENEKRNSLQSSELSQHSAAKQEFLLILPLSIYNGFVRYGIRGACLGTLLGICGWGFFGLLVLLQNSKECKTMQSTEEKEKLRDEEGGNRQLEVEQVDHGEESIMRMFMSLVFVDRMIVLCLEDMEIDIFEILGKLIEGLVLHWVSRLVLPKLRVLLVQLEKMVWGIPN